jgi:hypothetical protein
MRGVITWSIGADSASSILYNADEKALNLLRGMYDATHRGVWPSAVLVDGVMNSTYAALSTAVTDKARRWPPVDSK